MQKIQTNIMNKLICRRITFNYSFLSETILFNVGAKDLQTSHAKINLTFAVDILHFDGNGCILARYRLVKCISGPCHYRMPSVYVKFLQGKSNLEEIFGSKGDENYSWNPLFGIVSSIYTTEIYDHGDKQIVMTPYGICRIRFTKPADKLFRRRLDRCRLETTRNHSFIPALNTLSYNQNVSDNCYANLQLRILNNRLPIFKLFEGTNELISLIWNADGKPIEAFSSNLILQHLSYKFPLLSGLIASVDIIGSLSLKLIASSKMNLWNRDADLMITIEPTFYYKSSNPFFFL
ncbi:unnamed protein product [Dracunculus medinensis]|uniref:MTP_lip_bd domain-containing protein n=1 Tax=Dracunculus medinensis TaxID=318479 RepID=A0A158Q412_DRAME|nr:unnamed protein product [Dracunculus medinensis]